MRHMILLMALAGTVCFGADFSTGLHAYEKGDYAAAVAEWRPLAEKGDAPSQFNLGLLYIDGHGVPQDYSLAAHWFERAAEQDYVKAQLNLGALYGVGKGVKRDYVLAYKWLNLCAAKGDSRCAAQRDQVAQKMKSKDLATAQRLARDFKPQQEPGKDNPDR